MSFHTDVLMIQAPHLQAPHAFSTRLGGVSSGVYAAPSGAGGLNLDERRMLGVQDDPQAVTENRRRLTAALGFLPAHLSLLNQVHGTEVVTVTTSNTHSNTQPLPSADAQVTDRAGVLLGILTADCYPLLLEDPQAGVIGAAHAGWKGTLKRIAEQTVLAMQQLGARPERIRAAVGPGISAPHYAVGSEVARQFEAAGLGAHLTLKSEAVHLDLAAANQQVLLEAGLLPEQIWRSERCSLEPDFYSHRRDAGQTGRMLALIGMRA